MRRLMITSVCLSLIYAPFHYIFSETEPSPLPKESSWLKGHYVNKLHNYELNYPAQWERKEALPLDIILFAPIKTGALHSSATMNLIAENIGSEISMDQIYSEGIKNLNNELKELHIEDSGNKILNGIFSKWVRYTHVMQNVKYTVLQYFILTGEMIYLMTFSSPTDQYAEFQSNFENIASSFRLLSKNVEKKRV